MNQKNNAVAPELEEAHWVSTYGLLTAKRIFDLFNIHLTYDELVDAVKLPQNPYHDVLRVPFKNVFNGLIEQQAYDYQIYAQKLFVSYLLSGQPDKAPDAPGASTREELEQLRVQLVDLGAQFELHQFEQKQLIAESQLELGKVAAQQPLDQPKIEEVTQKYLAQAEHLTALFRNYRHQFHDLIEKITESMQLLQGYHMDQDRLEQHKIEIDFDGQIGEK